MSIINQGMNIRGYASITKPGILLVRLDLPGLSFRKLGMFASSSVPLPYVFQKKSMVKPRFQCSLAERTYSSSLSGVSRSKRNSNDMVKKGGASKRYPSETVKQGEAVSSLYARPSLAEMKKQKLENRARVYEFLKEIGVVPDELDGLELPVTVDVMKERVDFLHKLGLTIDDINNYPLVLGCSVKKNMIPVLDYLGKIGVRKSCITEFLRRYPQVLHSSVVVDLEPVVKYLQGMDIKPVDVPRVLEKYPEVLGFKLEGTMSTSVAYLVGIGVGRREIGGVLTRYPEILGMRVGRIIKPFVEYLEGLGIPRLAIARLIEKSPQFLGFGLNETVKPNVGYLVEIGVREKSLPSVIAQYPEIIGIDLNSKLSAQLNLFSSVLDLRREEFGQIIERMPQAVSINKTAVVKHIDFLKKCDFSIDQIKKMVTAYPQLLALNLDIMKLNIDYFQSEMDRPLDELVDFPAFFTYGLESTIKPRHQVVKKKGLKCSLSWLLNCSDEKFKQRLSYDSIDLEEMEPEPSFDMNSLMGSRNDESDSEFYDSDDEDV